MSVRNIFAIFIVSGLWHGANWTYVFWGGLNALYFLPSFLSKRNRKNLEFNSKLKWNTTGLAILWTFFITTVAWIFFRSASLAEAVSYINNIVSLDLTFENRATFIRFRESLCYSAIMVVIMLYFDWKNRFHDCGLNTVSRHAPMRYVVYILLLLLIFNDFSKESSFIYFQF